MKTQRLNNGYRMVLKPEYISSYKDGNFAGWIYEHRYVMEIELGRQIDESEIIHHLDCNKLNNKISNLILINKSTHIKLHNWIDSGCIVHESYTGYETKNNRFLTKQTILQYCLHCDLILQDQQINYCSINCYREYTKRKNLPTLEQLTDDYNNMSMVAIGKKYGVSDNGVRKWFRKYGVDNPRTLKSVILNKQIDSGC